MQSGAFVLKVVVLVEADNKWQLEKLKVSETHVRYTTTAIMVRPHFLHPNVDTDTSNHSITDRLCPYLSMSTCISLLPLWDISRGETTSEDRPVFLPYSWRPLSVRYLRERNQLEIENWKLKYQLWFEIVLPKGCIITPALFKYILQQDNMTPPMYLYKLLNTLYHMTGHCSNCSKTSRRKNL